MRCGRRVTRRVRFCSSWPSRTIAPRRLLSASKRSGSVSASLLGERVGVHRAVVGREDAQDHFAAGDRLFVARGFARGVRVAFRRGPRGGRWRCATCRRRGRGGHPAGALRGLVLGAAAAFLGRCGGLALRGLREIREEPGGTRGLAAAGAALAGVFGHGAMVARLFMWTPSTAVGTLRAFTRRPSPCHPRPSCPRSPKPPPSTSPTAPAFRRRRSRACCAAARWSTSKRASAWKPSRANSTTRSTATRPACARNAQVASRCCCSRIRRPTSRTSTRSSFRCSVRSRVRAPSMGRTCWCRSSSCRTTGTPITRTA